VFEGEAKAQKSSKIFGLPTLTLRENGLTEARYLLHSKKALILK
jgi:hypothetical protein